MNATVNIVPRATGIHGDQTIVATVATSHPPIRILTETRRGGRLGGEASGGGPWAAAEVGHSMSAAPLRAPRQVSLKTMFGDRSGGPTIVDGPRYVRKIHG